MKSEIAAVVEVEKMDLFAERLTVELQEKFEGHWVPEKPSKGQVYRCIRVNAFHKYDPELLRACRESGVHYGDLGLPWEMTLWVDPGEVCGSINSIHSGQTKLMFSTESRISNSQLLHFPVTLVHLMRGAHIPPPSPFPTGSAR
uniref:B-cell translocation gene 3 n=1 Tax=Gouania willdenowi TaxID=441366 RepID=A0A8C5EL99_GOUWI